MEIDKGLIGGSTVLMLLVLLNERDMYGYEIIKELKDRSDNTFEFKEGTLYPVLHRMENAGVVKSYRKEAENGKTRKYYAMTAKGIRLLADERKQWQAFTMSVDKVIGVGSYAFS
ncbi:hypothetical protein SDC9_119305 [bioreactor metagenome]|uniref:Transcription regulator PadR N-terminal domain-containing protein n=1 Tax=bioreactor metagenome TaxID=1076179 RepID=A0A645C3V3_9ZZZZ|nr:PadR family transcriptional regulator [Candidatus Metalachnospira sp.]